MSDQDDNQWRLGNAHHLKGVRLEHRRYTPWSEKLDHDHCAACWVNFAEFDAPDFEHEGYATTADYSQDDGYEWLCVKCAIDLKDELESVLEKGVEPGRHREPPVGGVARLSPR